MHALKLKITSSTLQDLCKQKGYSHYNTHYIMRKLLLDQNDKNDDEHLISVEKNGLSFFRVNGLCNM